MSRAQANVVPYEDRLKSDARWALSEGSRFFDDAGKLHDTIRALAQKLDELGVPYAIAGGMALFLHGYRRFTEDVDILVSPASLKLIHERLEGLGYVAPFAGSKNLRDTNTGVRIDFVVSGGYPGDGKPKPVAFPDPATVATDVAGLKLVNVETLINLKIACGRRKDLTDVQELIHALRLPKAFADRIHPSVRPVFEQLWDELAREQRPQEG